MTDDLERVFVEVKFKEGDVSIEEVAEQLRAALGGIPHEITITPNKPSSIFSAEEIENRFVNLFTTAQTFKAKFLSEFGGGIEIDPRLLYLATVSAYIDIERYKAYHLEKPYKNRSDAVKRAAYLTKWISRFSPIQSKFDLASLTPEEMLEQERLNTKPALASIIFAIQISMTHISNDCKKRTWLSPEATFDLAYDLLYRKVNEDSLLATYQKVVNLATGVSMIKN
jgi:hypothetical protein